MGLLNFIGKLLNIQGTPNQKIELSKSATASGLPIIYGCRRVDAITVLKRVSNLEASTIGNAAADVVSRGPNDRDDPLEHDNWLHRVDVWGQGPIQSIDRFWIDNDSDGHKRFASKRPYFRAASLLGTADQSSLSGLSTVTPQWSVNHKGLGVAYSWTRFFNSSKHPQYQAEPALRAEVKGLRLYDPRQDTAYGGTGTQSFSNESSWVYGNNRALVVLNYLISAHGVGALASELDMPSFMAAADYCDQDVTIPSVVTNQTGSQIPDWYNWLNGERELIDIGDVFPTYRPSQTGTVQKRFEADAVVDPKQDVVRNLEMLLEEVGYSLSWSNGRHRLVIEGPVSGPVMTLTEDDITGGLTIERGSRSNRLNRVTIEFPNANKNFEDDTVSWPERSSTTYAEYRNTDGGRDWHTNVPLDTVTDFYRAKAFAEFHVRRSRLGERITGLQLAPKALLLEPGDVVALDFPDKQLSGASDYFIVERVNVSGVLDVSVDLRRYDASIYTSEAYENEPLQPNDDSADPFVDPNAVNNLTAVEYHTGKADGSVVSGIALTWDAPTSGVPIERIEVKWRDAADVDLAATDDYEGTIVLNDDATACRIPNLVDDRQYRVVVSYVTRLRQRSIEAVADPVDLTATTTTKLAGIENGATRTEFRGAYSPSILYEKGDIVTSDGSSFVFISTISAVGTSLTDPLYWELLASVGADGAAGTDGGYFDVMFRRAASQPATPAGSAPAGWSDGPPEADGTALWMIKGLKGSDDLLVGLWSTPQEVGGSGLEIEYSANGIDGWQTTFQPGHLYMRQRLSGGEWSAAQRIIGEKGDPGAQGPQGPAGSPGSSGQDGDDGSDGEDGFTISASPTALTVLTTSNGVPKSGELPAISQIQLLQGNTDRTSAASYSRTAVNCNASVSSSGRVTINSLSADSGYVDVTASYGGASIKIRVTYVKARQGDAATSVEVNANVVNNTSYGVSAGPVSLSMGAGGTVEIDGTLTYTSTPDGNTQTIKVQYSTNGGSSWIDIGSAAFGSGEEFGFPGVAVISRSRSGPSSPATWQFRMLARKSGGSVFEFGSASNIRVQWV